MALPRIMEKKVLRAVSSNQAFVSQAPCLDRSKVYFSKLDFSARTTMLSCSSRATSSIFQSLCDTSLDLYGKEDHSICFQGRIPE